MTENTSTALATVAPAVMAPTNRSPQQLAARLSQMRQERSLVATFFKDVMVEGEDYGLIPGTGDKPTLLKPGAEKLAELYGFHPTVKNREEITDYDTGFYRCVITMALINDHGQSVGEGVGECNTREARYFYRWVTRAKVPQGMDVKQLKTEQRKNRQTGESFTLYRLENDDLFSLWNTVLKMAKKRALVDVVLSVTRSSSVFSKTTKGITDWIDAEYKDISDLEDEDDDDSTTAGINAAPITPEGKKPDGSASPGSKETRQPAPGRSSPSGPGTAGQAKSITDEDAKPPADWRPSAPIGECEHEPQMDLEGRTVCTKCGTVMVPK